MPAAITVEEKKKRADLIAELNQIVRKMDSHTLDQVVNFTAICQYVTIIPQVNQVLQGIVDAKDLQSAQVLAIQASQILVGDHG